MEGPGVQRLQGTQMLNCDSVGKSQYIGYPGGVRAGGFPVDLSRLAIKLPPRRVANGGGTLEQLCPPAAVPRAGRYLSQKE